MVHIAILTKNRLSIQLRPSALRLRTFVSERLSLDELKEASPLGDPPSLFRDVCIKKDPIISRWGLVAHFLMPPPQDYSVLSQSAVQK